MRRKVIKRLVEGHEIPFLSLSGLCGELRALLDTEKQGDADGERRAAAYGNALYFCLLLAEASERMEDNMVFWDKTLELTVSQG